MSDNNRRLAVHNVSVVDFPTDTVNKNDSTLKVPLWLTKFVGDVIPKETNIPKDLVNIIVSYTSCNYSIYLDIFENEWYHDFRAAYQDVILNANCGYRSYCMHCKYMGHLGRKYGRDNNEEKLFPLMNAEEMEKFHDEYNECGECFSIVKIDLAFHEIPDDMMIYINVATRGNQPPIYIDCFSTVTTKIILTAISNLHAV